MTINTLFYWHLTYCRKGSWRDSCCRCTMSTRWLHIAWVRIMETSKANGVSTNRLINSQNIQRVALPINVTPLHPPLSIFQWIHCNVETRRQHWCCPFKPALLAHCLGHRHTCQFKCGSMGSVDFGGWPQHMEGKPSSNLDDTQTLIWWWSDDMQCWHYFVKQNMQSPCPAWAFSSRGYGCIYLCAVQCTTENARSKELVILSLHHTSCISLPAISSYPGYLYVNNLSPLYLTPWQSSNSFPTEAPSINCPNVSAEGAANVLVTW